MNFFKAPEYVAQEMPELTVAQAHQLSQGVMEAIDNNPNQARNHDVCMSCGLFRHVVPEVPRIKLALRERLE